MASPSENPFYTQGNWGAGEELAESYIDYAEATDEGERHPGWVVAAVVLSLIFHGALYWALGLIPWVIQGGEVGPDERAFELKRVEFDPSVLENEPTSDAPLETVALHKVQEIAVDEYEVQENLPEEEVRLTPEVEEFKEYLTESEPEIEQGQLQASLSALPETQAEVLEKEIDSLQQELLREAEPASPQQPVLELADEEGEGLQSLLESEGQGAPQGYSDLDKLLSQSGQLTEGTEPILMPTDLLFDYDQAELQEAAKLSLMKLGILIRRNPRSRFIIEGHCDTFGTDEYNLNLSKQRALAVKQWLIDSMQIDPKFLRIRGFGEKKPIVNPEGSVEEQALNRRVEIVIQPL